MLFLYLITDSAHTVTLLGFLEPVVHDCSKVNVVGKHSFTTVKLPLLFSLGAEGEPSIQSLLFKEVVSQEHTLLELCFLDLAPGPVGLQRTIHFLFDYDVHVGEDLFMSRYAVDSIEPLAQEVLFHLALVSL